MLRQEKEAVVFYLTRALTYTAVGQRLVISVLEQMFEAVAVLPGGHA